MNDESKLKLHSFCVWSGIIFVVLIATAMIFLAKIFPPPSPALSAEEVATMLLNKATGFRLGMILIMISAVFYTLFITVVAHYVSIVEKHVGVLTVSIALAGALNLVAFVLPALIWITAVFRVNRSPELIQTLYDFGWLAFLGLIAPTVLLLIATAIAALVDKREKPLFPRWFGFFNLFAISIYLPGQLIFFFHKGVFAWDGLVGFWLPAIDFFLQLLLTIYFVWVAVNLEKARIRV